jgi:hypothetical protein
LAGGCTLPRKALNAHTQRLKRSLQMPVRPVQGKRSPKSALKAPPPEHVTAQKALAVQCEKWFENLPEVPTGVLLSKQGAIAAVKAAASHFALEMKRFNASQESSRVSLQLKDIADEAQKAALALAEANSHFQEINRRIGRLGVDAKKRISVVPSPTIRLLNDSESEYGGLLSNNFDDAIKIYGDATISDVDQDVLRSEILLWLDRDKEEPYITLKFDAEINRLVSLESVSRAAASLPRIANSKGGPKRAFQEFSLYPTYQLVEACMAILHASNLPPGNSKVGLLFDLATEIRQSVEGPDAEAITKAIGDLPKKTTDKVKRLAARVDYWSICLLIKDLRSLDPIDSDSFEELAELEDKGKSLHTLISWKAAPKRDKTGTTVCHILEREAFENIDASSPFGQYALPVTD